MRKLVAVCLAAVMMTGCVSLPKLNVGIGVSAVIPEESTLDNTYMVDGFVRLDVATIQAELDVGWKTYDYDEDGDGFTEGELTQIPVAATIRWVTGPAIARLIVGGGLVWNISDLDELGAITVEDAVGYRAILGVDFKIIQDFRIAIEGIYDFSEADLSGGSTPTVDSSSIMARVAIAYNF